MTLRRTPRDLLLVPSAVVLLGLFIAPLATFLAISFWRAEMFRMTPALSLHNYIEVVREYWFNIAFSAGVGLVIGTVSSILAFSFAYVLRFKAGRLAPAMLFIVMTTMFGGYLIKIYGWKTILGNTGLINSVLLGLGVIDAPLTFLIYTPFAVCVALIHYLLPLGILPIYAALRAISDTSLEAARDLGASPGRVFLDHVLPRCRAGLQVALVLSFLISAGDFVTPTLVGGTYTPMVGMFIHLLFTEQFNWPLGAALTFSALTISLLMIVLFHALLTRLRPRW